MPFLVFVPIASALVVIPYASGWAPLDISTGALFFLAVPGLSVLGILLAGWSSQNTYASIGGVRAAAQMISYELPRTLSVLALCLLAGSLSAGTIRAEWRLWWIPLTALGFVVYFISSIAEVNRGPFDLPEAESELVAGYFADYSGIRWAIFMMVGVRRHRRCLALWRGRLLWRGSWPSRAARRHRVCWYRRCDRHGDDLGEVDLPAHASGPAHGPGVEGPHADGARAARHGGGGAAVALEPARPDVNAPDRTPQSVPLKVSVSNDFSPGVKGFVERWSSLITG